MERRSSPEEAEELGDLRRAVEKMDTDEASEEVSRKIEAEAVGLGISSSRRGRRRKKKTHPAPATSQPQQEPVSPGTHKDAAELTSLPDPQPSTSSGWSKDVTSPLASLPKVSKWRTDATRLFDSAVTPLSSTSSAVPHVPKWGPRQAKETKTVRDGPMVSLACSSSSADERYIASTMVATQNKAPPSTCGSTQPSGFERRHNLPLRLAGAEVPCQKITVTANYLRMKFDPLKIVSIKSLTLFMLFITLLSYHLNTSQ